MGHSSRRWMQTYAASTNSLGKTSVWQPLVDIYRTKAGWLIKYDLAGVLPEDVTLTLEGRRLTLRGTRRDCCIEKGYCHYHMEISYSQFERTIELPNSLDRARVMTEHWHGLLLVRVEEEASR